MGLSLNNHSMSKGKSPDETRQLMETESSKFAGSSPKSKFAILGATRNSLSKKFFRDGD